MSEALDYLLAARPEAMHSYFSFLKAAGQHLDPRTRAIISVITKVDNQTQKGFRQYLRRALRAGVSAGEILDAMLLAFPTLGLSKIVWAIDQILDMDLDEFRLENLEGAHEWHEITSLYELGERGGRGFCRDGKTVFVWYDGVTYQVYDGVCPHQSTLLSVDDLAGTIVTCPRHRWQFALDNGRCIAVGDRPLRQLQSRIEGDHLYAYW